MYFLKPVLPENQIFKFIYVHIRTYIPSHYWDLFRPLFKTIILQMTFPSTSLGLHCIFSPLNLLKVGYVGQITLTIDLQQKYVCYTMTKIWMSHVDGVIRQLWGSHQTVNKRSLEINLSDIHQSFECYGLSFCTTVCRKASVKEIFKLLQIFQPITKLTVVNWPIPDWLKYL